MGYVYPRKKAGSFEFPEPQWSSGGPGPMRFRHYAMLVVAALVFSALLFRLGVL